MTLLTLFNFYEEFWHLQNSNKIVLKLFSCFQMGEGWREAGGGGYTAFDLAYHPFKMNRIFSLGTSEYLFLYCLCVNVGNLATILTSFLPYFFLFFFNLISFTPKCACVWNLLVFRLSWGFPPLCKKLGESMLAKEPYTSALKY